MSKYPTNVAVTYIALASTQGMPGNTFVYSWSFDDGGSGSGASLAHTWTTDGNHIATITATDNITLGTATANKLLSTSSATWVGNTAAARDWGTITYGGGLFVTAANDNATATAAILVSPDGSTWTPHNSLASANFTGSAYGNGTFVLVGTHAGTNYVLYSTDAITWSAPTFPSKQWQCVAYGNGVFVALCYFGGVTGQAMTSPDGITWTSRNTSTDQDWRGICYAGGQFVAVGNGATTMTSPDGITWTSHSASVLKDWSRVAYGNGIYVAIARVATSGNIMWSRDGITWNTASTPDAIQLGSVSFGNGMFVLTVQNTPFAPGSYMTPDCVTFFSIATDVSNGIFRASVYGTDRFVAMSGSSSAKRAQVLLW